jgi:hypothetical protein
MSYREAFGEVKRLRGKWTVNFIRELVGNDRVVITHNFKVFSTMQSYFLFCFGTVLFKPFILHFDSLFLSS